MDNNNTKPCCRAHGRATGRRLKKRNRHRSESPVSNENCLRGPAMNYYIIGRSQLRKGKWPSLHVIPLDSIPWYRVDHEVYPLRGWRG